MQYRVLGSTGMRVSTLCLGTALFGVAPRAEEVDGLVGAAIDAGINLFDTANAYGNLPHFDRPGAPPAAEREPAEELLGRALVSRRDQVVLTTKAREPVGSGVNDRGLSRKHLLQQLEASLTRLRTDHVDVFYAHHPDADTGLDDTLRTLDDIVRQGKARAVALSTYPAWETVEALWICDDRRLEPPACVQVRYSLLDQRASSEVVPVSRRFGLGLVVFSPLAGGLLAGASGRTHSGEKRWGGGDHTQEQLDAVTRLESLTDDWGVALHHAALHWLLRQEHVTTAIIGPESIDELRASLPSLDLDLTAEQLAELGDIGASVTRFPENR